MTAVVDIADVTGQEPGVVEDEALAVRCAATTCLITAAMAADVEAVARRIHAAGLRAAFPFVHVSADTLPTDATRFAEACASLVDAARGGTLLITNVEAMPAVVQESLIETLAQLQGASDPVDAVRLIAGTTVVLHDCIVTGTFSGTRQRRFHKIGLHILSVRTGVGDRCSRLHIIRRARDARLRDEVTGYRVGRANLGAARCSLLRGQRWYRPRRSTG